MKSVTLTDDASSNLKHESFPAFLSDYGKTIDTIFTSIPFGPDNSLSVCIRT